MAARRPSLDLRRIPERLREIARWVLWRYVTRKGKRTKVPCSAIDGRAASATDPATWSTFDEAVTAFEKGGFDGIGFVFSPDDGLCGIDLDNCIGQSGELEPWARGIVDRVATYTEVSPSGRGVKLFAVAKLPPGRRRRDKVELYDTGRFFTVTGQHLPGTPTTVENRQAEIDALHAEIFGEGSPPPRPRPVAVPPPVAGDDELLAKARAARNGAKFSALFDHGDTSDHNGDHSAADLALCSHLAFWTGGDPAAIDRLFRRSALMRPKWDERRGESTYGERTIRAALRRATEFYEPPEQRPGPRPIEPEEAEHEGSAPVADAALQEFWALGSDPDPRAVADALQRVAALLKGASPLTVQTVRALALRAFKDKVPAPAKMVDAALAGIVTATRPPSPPDDATAGLPYRATRSGLVHLKQTKEGEVPVPLTNFTAQIVTDVARDDGVEVRRSFEIEAHHRGRVHRFEVSATRFPSLAWVAEHLGATAILNAGFNIRDHVRAAIQYLSRDVRARILYTHLGWRRIGDQWCYLHAGGAIGPDGPVPDVETDLPQQLRLYQLPEPGDSDALVRSVRASLQVLDVLPDVVTMPVYSGAWRSVLGPSDHSLHVTGRTGEGKSELSALAQQHFGPGLDARNLPGSWSSTGNSLEVLAFAAKDGLLVVDDFAPEGTAFDVQHQHRDAARLLRAQGNRSGRGRLRPDGELRPTKTPRGLILSTGEEVPGGQSIRARLFCLDVPAGAMDWNLLTRCQADAAAGLYAQAMTGYLMWVARRYDELMALGPRRTQDLRERATASEGQHRRTPSIVADLAFGLETFLRFARDVDALSEAEAAALWERGWTALGEAAAAQAEHVASAEPTRRFVELLTAALASGRAHVASEEGTAPEAPGVWGWRHGPVWTSEYSPRDWLPLGDRIGWVRGEDLYLEPRTAYRIAQAMASTDGLSIQPVTLWKRLREKGLLASVDEAREQNQIRVTLEGARRAVLHLRAETVMPQKPAQPAQPAHEVETAGLPGRLFGAGSAPEAAEPAQQTRPADAESLGVSEVSGRLGRVGRVPEGEPSAVEEPWGEV